MLNFIGAQFRQPKGPAGKLVSLLMKKGNLPAYDRILPLMDIQAGNHILEIGFGHGLGLQRICREFDCRVRGIDFSELMYREAARRNRKYIENKKLELHLGDYLQKSFPPESFDRTFLINVIYFWTDLRSSFQKLYTELKKGGMVCIFMAHREELNKIKFTVDSVFNKYLIEEVMETLRETGFSEVEYELNNGYCIRCRK